MNLIIKEEGKNPTWCVFQEKGKTYYAHYSEMFDETAIFEVVNNCIDWTDLYRDTSGMSLMDCVDEFCSDYIDDNEQINNE